jgi:predicted phosphodiesterase
MKKAKKKSQKDIRRELIEKFSEAIIQASKTYGVDNSLITKAQFGEFSELSDWELRKLGGFDSIKKSVFPFDGDQDLASIRELGKAKAYISKLERGLGDKQSFEKRALETIESSIKSLNIKKTRVKKKAINNKKKMTMELMISDVHYGKKTTEFNLDVCQKRMQKVTEVFLGELEQKDKFFNVEKVVIALIGDIIESYSMHGQESALACEFANPKQVQEAIKSLFWDVIYPIAQTGIKVSIPAVTGNHDRTETKKTLNNPGENNLTWIIYNTLDMLCDAHNLSNVTFDIPICGYTHLNIYGSIVLYEHGDELQNVNKDTIFKHMEKRGRQIKKQIHMARFGHYHEYVCFDRGKAIVNESVCGQDSYALEKGFDSTAGQTINFYVETSTRPTSFYYSFPIFLG